MATVALVEEPDPREFADSSPHPASDKDLVSLQDALLKQGITRIVVHYEGSGDSGCIESVEYEPENTALPRSVDDRLRDTVENYCPAGYENNEGGWGMLTIHPRQGLAELEHYDRYESSQTMNVQTPPLTENLQQQLSQQGVVCVTALFDGYGDSGQLDDFTFEPESTEPDEQLEEELEAFLLDQLPDGWENGEGGYGTFTIDVASGKVEIDASWRVEKSSDAQHTRWQWRK